jgi:hypothetical protein
MKNTWSREWSACVLLLAAFSALEATASELEAVYTVQAPQGQWVVRALTHAAQCPGHRLGRAFARDHAGACNSSHFTCAQ